MVVRHNHLWGAFVDFLPSSPFGCTCGGRHTPDMSHYSRLDDVLVRDWLGTRQAGCILHHNR